MRRVARVQGQVLAQPVAGERDVCLILGAGAGVGQAVARKFAEEGLHVVCMRRGGETPGSLEALCAELNAAGHAATTIYGDVTKVEDIARAVDSAEAIGPVRCAVYNVGAQVGNRDLQETSYRIFERAWRMGTLGAFALAKEVVPRMEQRGGGTLIYTSATAAMRGNRGQSAHAAAMFGRRALCQSLNHELGQKGIHVAHVVVEGMIDAPESLGRIAPKLFEQLRDAKLADQMIVSPVSVASSYWFLHTQTRDAWTLELDLRPWADTPWWNSDASTGQGGTVAFKQERQTKGAK